MDEPRGNIVKRRTSLRTVFLCVQLCGFFTRGAAFPPKLKCQLLEVRLLLLSLKVKLGAGLRVLCCKFLLLLISRDGSNEEDKFPKREA